MGFLSVPISAVAAYLFYITGNYELMILAVITVFGNLWSWRLLRNEANSATKWIIWMNMAFTTIGIVLLFTGIIKMYY